MAVATKRDFVINYGLQTDRTGTSTGNTLFVDQVNDKVGIGQGSPAYTLDVSGDINFTGTLYKNGAEHVASRWTLTGSDIYRLSKVGIGTTSPARPLHISNGGAEGIEFGPGESGNVNLSLHFNRSSSVYVGNETRASYHSFFIGSSEKARIHSSGNVGIADTNPDQKLVVAGNIRTTGALYGPSNFIIDPSTVGDDTGTVEIKGNLVVQGTTTTINSTTLDLDHLSLGDNEVANFGNSNDLQIYHDGPTNRTIIDDSSGGFKVQSDGNISFTKGATENLAVFEVDGAVKLYYDNNIRFETTTDGADISGTGSLKVPVGTTAERSDSPVAGDIRFNSELVTYEGYNGNEWGGLGGAAEKDTTVATTAATTCEQFDITTHRSATITTQITQGTDYQIGRYLVIHDGTTASIIEQAAVATGDMLGSFSVTISGGNLLFQVNMNNSSSATVTSLMTKISV